MSRTFWRSPRRILPIRSRISDLSDGDQRMREAASWPLEECLLSEDWAEHGAAVLLWVRRCPERVRYAMVHLTLDLAGRGVPRCLVELSLRRSELWGYREGCPTKMMRTDPSLARRLVQVARARGERTGAEDPDEWPFAEPLLGPATVAHVIPEFQRIQTTARPVEIQSTPLLFATGRAAEA